MPVKKPTAADRPEFRREMAKMMETLGMQVGEVDSDAIVCCSRAADFNPDDNILWENEANKSVVRPDVHCFNCDAIVAMSNHAYSRWFALDKKPRVCCTHCMGTLLKEEGADKPFGVAPVQSLTEEEAARARPGFPKKR